MAELVTSAQMRAIEQAAFDSKTVTGAELMERAGTGALAAALDEWPDLAEGAHHAVVLCGPGNNGGDGYVVARLLHERGWRVEVFALGDPASLTPDAARNHAAWVALGPVEPLAEAGVGARPHLMVDALFGTGLSRAIPEEAAQALAGVPRRPVSGARVRCRRLAIDCPSGLDCDAGTLLLPPRPPEAEGDDEAAHEAHLAWWDHAQTWINGADLTVTFHSAKVGHYLDQGPGLCGALRRVDIGIGAFDETETLSLSPPSPARLRLVGRQQMGHEMPSRMWPGQVLPVNSAGRHKYDRGHALILSGGVGRGGAARLAARAALRVGAGLVTVGCPPAALQENAACLDAIMLRAIKDAEALDTLLSDPRIGSICLGPGLGVGERTRTLVASALARREEGRGRAVILDADALTSFSERPETLFDMLNRMCVLTPHEGEFARLFPDLSERQRRLGGVSKVDAVRAAADRAGCTILLKGADTVIASPGGAASLHAAFYGREAPWLGTAGAGDVLAGLIAGMLAPPHGPESPHMAVETAAWLHVEAARSFGPGLIAEDLPEELPKVFSFLEL